MDNKKLARLIDRIVDMRLKKILRSSSFKQVIKETVYKEMIGLLLENNNKPSAIAKQPIQQRKINLNDIVDDDNKRVYPVIPKKNVQFTKNTAINDILNQTAAASRGTKRFKNPNLNKMNISAELDPVALQNENLIFAQGELSRYGINAENMVDLEAIPSNIELSQEDMLSEGIHQINTDALIELASQDERLAPVIDAMTRDYSEVMKLVDEKVKQRRPTI